MADRTITTDALHRYTRRDYGQPEYRPVGQSDGEYVTIAANDGGTVRLTIEAWSKLLEAHARLRASLALIELWRKQLADREAQR